MAQCGDKITFYASQTEFWVDVVYYIMTDNRYLNTLALSSGISRGEDGLRNGAHVVRTTTNNEHRHHNHDNNNTVQACLSSNRWSRDDKSSGLFLSVSWTNQGINTIC